METSAATEIADLIFSHTQSNGESSDVHIWDVPWSTDDIRKYSQSWSLAGDAGLLNKLQDMAQTLVSKTHQVQQEVNGLVEETEATHAKLHNAVNDFLMLSNMQFVESRVYDEEINNSLQSENKKEVPEKSKEERDSEIIAKVAEALHLGMSVIDTAYEQLELQNSDSEEEAEPYRHEPLLHPKDPYSDRPLPYIIGSQKFMEDDHVGLGGSSSEEEIVNEISSISSEENLPQRKENFVQISNKSVQNLEDEEGRTDRDYESEGSRSSDIFNPSDKEDMNAPDNIVDNAVLSTKISLEKELTAKLKPSRKKLSYDDESSMSSSSISDDVKKTSSKRKKKRVMSKPSTDHQNESNHDSVTPAVKTSQIPGSKSVPNRNEMSESGTKEESDEDDDNLFGDKRLFSKKKGGLFDNDEDEEDLFLGSKNFTSLENDSQQDLFIKASDKKKINTDGSVKHEKIHRLFGEDTIFADDIESGETEDLFSVLASKKNDKKREVFDKGKANDEEEDDDLFKKKEVTNSTLSKKKKVLAGAVSALGAGVNPSLFRLPQHSKENDESDEVASVTPSISNKSVNLHDDQKESPSNSGSSSSIAFFADEPEVDDLFGQPSANESKQTYLGGISFTESNDEEDIEDIFAVKPKTVAPVMETSGVISESKQKVPPKTKPRSAFVDVSDTNQDLFSSDKTTRQTLNKTEDDVMKNSLMQNTTRPRIKSQRKLSLFDDDDDDGGDIAEDLFKEILPSKSMKTGDKNITAALSKPRTNSLFDDDELLFGSAQPDNPEVDLFGSVTKPIKMKDDAKHSEIKKKAASKVEAPSIMPKTKLDDPVFDEDESDLFGVSNVKKTSERAHPSLPVPRKERVIKDLEALSNIEVSLEVQKDEQNVTEDISVPQTIPKISSIMESPRKKPVGGVAMFGGIMPPLLKQSRAVSPVRKLHTEPVEDQGPPLSPLRDAFILPPSGIAKSPVNEVPVSFDDPVEANPLHSTNKDRIKVQVKRRPPTRRGRQEALRRSAIDILRERQGDKILNANEDAQRMAVSAPTSPISPEVQSVEGFPKLSMETNKLSVESARITSIASPSTEEEDLFLVGDPIVPFSGQGSSFGRTSPGPVIGGNVSPKKSSEGKDLFGGSSDDGETDDLFKPQPTARTTISSKKLSPKVSPKLECKAEVSDKGPAVEEDGDSSAGISSVLKESGFDHTKDIAKETVQQQPPTSNVSKKVHGKLDSSKRPKSLFDEDDDDDDLFKASSTVRQNVKSSVRSTSASVKNMDSTIRQTTSSLLKEIEDNLFEDPLMGNKK